jgi:HEAT repeat protein
MDIQTRIEAAFQREIAAGRMTHHQATILGRQLDRLAFQMTAVGYSGEAPKALAVAWMLHLRRFRGKPSKASARELAQAARWWALGIAAGVLHETEERLAFADRALQEECCLHFCTTHPFSAPLLRLMARETFRPLWRRWAVDDPTLADHLNAVLLAERPVKGRLYAARALHFLGDQRAIDPLLAALHSPDQGTCIRAALALATLGDPRALEPLNRRQLQEEQLSLRVPLIEALGRFGLPATPFLAALLNQPQGNVVYAAIRGLGATGAPEAAALLVTILTGPGLHTSEVDLATALKEIDTLNQLVTSSFLAITSRKDPLSADHWETFSAMMTRSQRAEHDRRKAEAAVEALGMLGEAAVPALLTALDHEHHLVRAYVDSARGWARRMRRAPQGRYWSK